MAGSEYYDDDGYAYRSKPTPNLYTDPYRDPYLQESRGTARMIERITKMNEMGLNPNDNDDVELFFALQKRIEENKSASLDPNVQSVIDKYEDRARVGFEKYGTNTTRTDIDLQGWLTHLQEELMDATIYIERLKNDI